MASGLPARLTRIRRFSLRWRHACVARGVQRYRKDSSRAIPLREFFGTKSEAVVPKGALVVGIRGRFEQNHQRACWRAVCMLSRAIGTNEDRPLTPLHCRAEAQRCCELRTDLSPVCRALRRPRGSIVYQRPLWGIARPQPKTAFSRFPPILRANLKRQVLGRLGQFAKPSANGRSCAGFWTPATTRILRTLSEPASCSRPRLRTKSVDLMRCRAGECRSLRRSRRKGPAI